MIVPEELFEKCYVPNAVKVKIIDPDAIFITGILGESGRRMVRAGLLFYFEQHLANKLIKNKVAKRVD